MNPGLADDAPPLRTRYRAARERTAGIFALLDDNPAAWEAQPIPLRHPFRFYEGHLAAFNHDQLRQCGAAAPLDEDLVHVFIRGIDPLDADAAGKLRIDAWPARARVREFIAAVGEQMEAAFGAGADPQPLHTCVEHEEMHQETLTYMLHELDHRLKFPATPLRTLATYEPTTPNWLEVPAGTVRLGVAPGELPFAWDNEMPAHAVNVGDFHIADRKITNGEYLEFVEAGGYTDARWWLSEDWASFQSAGGNPSGRPGHPHFWRRESGVWIDRGLLSDCPLRLDRPVYVSHAEAAAYCRWRGLRLPTEAEWQRAADLHALPPEPQRDGFDCTAFEPLAVQGGGAQFWGNGWEWTSTPFAGFQGFTPQSNYPGYSADFFDQRHFVLRGASHVTAAGLVRRSFRNWFQNHYPYAYTAFRPVQNS